MAHGSEDQLGKGLRQRHLAMIAIGGVIAPAFSSDLARSSLRSGQRRSSLMHSRVCSSSW